VHDGSRAMADDWPQTPPRSEHNRELESLDRGSPPKVARTFDSDEKDHDKCKDAGSALQEQEPVDSDTEALQEALDRMRQRTEEELAAAKREKREKKQQRKKERHERRERRKAEKRAKVKREEQEEDQDDQEDQEEQEQEDEAERSAIPDYSSRLARPTEAARHLDLRRLFKEGQSYLTPPVADATRVFYETLLEENPSSKIAIKYCVEHGILPFEAHQRFLVKYRHLKATENAKKGGRNSSKAPLGEFAAASRRISQLRGSGARTSSTGLGRGW